MDEDKDKEEENVVGGDISLIFFVQVEFKLARNR